MNIKQVLSNIHQTFTVLNRVNDTAIQDLQNNTLPRADTTGQEAELRARTIEADIREELRTLYPTLKQLSKILILQRPDLDVNLAQLDAAEYFEDLYDLHKSLEQQRVPKPPKTIMETKSAPPFDWKRTFGDLNS